MLQKQDRVFCYYLQFHLIDNFGIHRVTIFAFLYDVLQCPPPSQQAAQGPSTCPWARSLQLKQQESNILKTSAAEHTCTTNSVGAKVLCLVLQR
jgi:hypothetical protein